MTGEHSGRSPNDRFIVHDSLTGDEVFWGEINKAISEENFLRLQKKMQSHLSEKDVFVHITAVVESGLNELVEGQKVSFESIEEAKGLKATNISQLPADEDN